MVTWRALPPRDYRDDSNMAAPHFSDDYRGHGGAVRFSGGFRYSSDAATLTPKAAHETPWTVETPWTRQTTDIKQLALDLFIVVVHDFGFQDCRHSQKTGQTQTHTHTVTITITHTFIQTHIQVETGTNSISQFSKQHKISLSLSLSPSEMYIFRHWCILLAGFNPVTSQRWRHKPANEKSNKLKGIEPSQSPNEDGSKPRDAQVSQVLKNEEFCRYLSLIKLATAAQRGRNSDGLWMFQVTNQKYPKKSKQIWRMLS